MNSNEILFDVNGYSNCQPALHKPAEIKFEKHPPSFDKYLNGFNKVQHHIRAGNTYLLNLTFRSPVLTNLTLDEIFLHSSAKFRLLYKDKFVVFSPETFIIIKGNSIFTYPMKGTIDAGIPNAEQIILADKKEHAEHATIVDLLRNDLSIVAKNVTVNRFRYIDKVVTPGKNLLQVSSEIAGTLRNEYRGRFGDILSLLLPAGSVTGAPKKKTVEIIRETENYDRGFFTGVFGIYDGSKLESGVMIRFIENDNGNLYFKSGGGITSFSDPRKEYDELVDKIYLPVV